MDEYRTPVSSWLAFALAFDASASLISHLRDQQLSISAAGALIHQFINDEQCDHKHAELTLALRDKVSPAKLSYLRSSELQARVNQALHWESQRPDHHLLAIDSPAYSKRLYETADAPPLLYAKGNLLALQKPALAIVGSRKASHLAIDHTRKLAANLACRGITIVSGLAIGIDAAAHIGALEAGGTTIAISATEPDSVYPKRHRQLAQRIIDSGGLILTEYPLGAPTLKWYFPRRNRIISGLSNGVLIAEAALPSGSLTTATHAINQGRDVMAVPGAVSNPQSRGCHWLIKQGAALIESADDVLDSLGSAVIDQLVDSTPNSERQAINSSKYSRNDNDSQDDSGNALEITYDETDSLSNLILEHLSGQPATADELITRMKSTDRCGIAQLSAAIGLLEIHGKIRASTGGRYSRC